MIISFKHKFIFIKTRKTGGTSIQVELSKHCGPDDIILGELVDDTGKVWESYGPGKNADKFGSDNPHPDILSIKQWIDGNGYNWDEFKKFVIVRNPFDLVVSRYHWDIGGKGKQETSILGFRGWLRNYISFDDYIKDVQYHYTHIDGLMSVDYIGYYEDLDKSYKDICNLIGIEYQSLPNLKSGVRPKNKHCYNYYTDVEASLVMNNFKDDFDTFGYPKLIVKPFTEVGFRHQVIWDNLPETSLLNNMNGPSVIRIPQFIKDDIGLDYKYQMFFAHHQGKSIRYAYSNFPVSGWTWLDSIVNLNNTLYTKSSVLNECLKLEDTYCDGHIASPDVHVDATALRMYYHGDMNGKQYSFFTTSVDGFDFHKRDKMKKPLGNFYFRVFDYKDKRYAIAKENNDGGILYELDWETEEYIPVFNLLPNMRHCSVLIKNDLLYIFYTNIGDIIEHIRVATLELSDNVDNWTIINDIALLYPEKDWEGVDSPMCISQPGAIYGLVKQLRDPYIFEDTDGRLYLYYAAGGENSIGCVELLLNY